jgi:hypothetical protein
LFDKSEEFRSENEIAVLAIVAGFMAHGNSPSHHRSYIQEEVDIYPKKTTGTIHITDVYAQQRAERQRIGRAAEKEEARSS